MNSDDTLLDEDLGDEEYDLGNDEEEALLADDYEVDRQNSYKGEEETDDVLDLGVTDALDDLDGEDENIEFSRSNTDKGSDNNFYKDGEHADVQSYGQNESVEHETTLQSDGNKESISVTVSNNIAKGDLREKLQKNMQKNIYIDNGQEMEDDDCDEARERRNRFQNERTIVSPKMNNDIPETLENVVTSEPYRGYGHTEQFRGRGGKSRGARGGSRGGRFNVQNVGNFNPRFGTVRQGSNFVDNQPICRPPLIETRPPLIETRPPLLEARPPFHHLGVPSNVQNQQIIYQQQGNPQQPFQQPFGPSGPIQGPPTQFPENRSQFNPGQFQSLMGPRPMNPRLPEYGPRPPLLTRPMQGGSNYNCAPNHPPMQSPMQPPIPSPMQSSMQQPFQNPGGILQESHRPMQGPPLLQGNPQGRGSFLGVPNMSSGNPPHMLPSGGGNPPMPIQGFPRQQQSMPPPSQGLPMSNLPPNVQMPPNQPPPFENRPPPPPPPPSFQEPPYQERNAYDTRSGYHPDQMSGGQFNDTMQQTSSNMSLPPGHKILINPHFRGTVQPTNDARLAWDSNHQVQSVSHNEHFPSMSSYQNQGPYSQRDPPSQNYHQNYQQNKSDDPYAYFSDVWQENRPQKPQNTSPSKHYSSDSNYFREETYSDKYKSDSQWDQKNSYQEDHKRSYQSYREGNSPIRRTIRDEHPQRGKTPPSTYRSDQNHNPKPRPSNVAPSGANRPQKRVSNSSDRESWEVTSKRVKPLVNRSQEEHRVERAGERQETVAETKDEDSDPEMREYRKKMEEQKRLRERILREKENRRKMAAIEKQNEDTKNNSSVSANENTQLETKPVSALMGIVKDGVSAVTPRPAVKGRGRPVNTQSAEATERSSNVRIIRTVPIVQTNDLSNTTGPEDNNSGEIAQKIQVVQQSSSRRVVIHNPQKVVTTIQKTISNVPKNQGLQQKVSNMQVVHPQKIVQNQTNAFQKSAVAGSKTVPANQRMVTNKAGGLQKTVINENAQRIANMQQNSQRIVLQKSGVQVKRSPEIKTNTVRLENLAASTTEAQIKRMCQPIGTIESIHMGEGNATIVFKTQSAAMVFHKKYQRKMLDLSLISVRLMPQSTSDNKVATAVAKTS